MEELCGDERFAGADFSLRRCVPSRRDSPFRVETGQRVSPGYFAQTDQYE